MPARHQRDRLEVALDVVGQLRHHVAGDRERADRPHADRVAVGLGLGGEVEADGERAARPIVDHDLLPELLREFGAENARDRVGRAAGGLRDDQPDGPVRVLGRRAGRKRAGSSDKVNSSMLRTSRLTMPDYGAAFSESTRRPAEEQHACAL